MSRNFEGMNGREIREMPMTADATGLQLAQIFGGDKVKIADGFAEVAVAQHRYVEEVYARCPDWRRRKKRKLKVALDHAARVRRILEPRGRRPYFIPPR